MPCPIIAQHASLLTIREEIVYTLSRLTADSLGKTWAPDFEKLRDDWKTVHEKELSLTDALTSGGAVVDGADDALDPMVDRLSDLLLDRTHRRRDDDLYRRYFGTQRPSDIKRPVLGRELELLNKTWVPSLFSSPDSELSAFGKALSVPVGVAVKAQIDWTEARRVLTDFRLLGDRKAFIDRVNQVRQTVYGQLAALPHDHPDLHLPKSFGDRFFRHRAVADHTEASLQAALAEHEQSAKEIKDQLDKLRAERLEEEQKKKDAERAGAEAKLADAQKQVADAQAQLDALKKKLEDPPK
jgi:hypothetical protein